MENPEREKNDSITESYINNYVCARLEIYRYIDDGGWCGCYRRVNAPASGRNHWRNDDVISSTRTAARSLPILVISILLYHILAPRCCCRRIPPFYPCPHTSLLASESIIVLLCLVAIHLHKIFNQDKKK